MITNERALFVAEENLRVKVRRGFSLDKLLHRFGTKMNKITKLIIVWITYFLRALLVRENVPFSLNGIIHNFRNLLKVWLSEIEIFEFKEVLLDLFEVNILKFDFFLNLFDWLIFIFYSNLQLIHHHMSFYLLKYSLCENYSEKMLKNRDLLFCGCLKYRSCEKGYKKIKTRC